MYSQEVSEAPLAQQRDGTLLLVLSSGDCRSVGKAGSLVRLLLVACGGWLGLVSLRFGGLLHRAAAFDLAV
jgi:hypothetical protein